MNEKITLNDVMDKLNKIESEMGLISKDVEETKDTVGNLDSKVNKLDTKVNKLDTKVDKLDTKLNTIENQQKENTRIIKAIEHRSDVHKAEMDQITNNIAQIQGEVKGLREFKEKVKLDLAEIKDDLKESKENIQEVKEDVSLANTTAAKNRLDIERIKNIR